jgi:hypothetical protein
MLQAVAAKAANSNVSSLGGSHWTEWFSAAMSLALCCVLLLLQVDDLIATGGTLKAGINLMSEWPAGSFTSICS